MIKKGWGIDRNMEVHEMPDNNAFLFRFTSQSDYIKILKGLPWSILGALLNLQHWDEFTVIQEVDFGWCPFWIQFHGLPHNTLDDDNAITLGNAVGRVMMYESPQDGGKLSRTFIRTRSLVNIHEPLVPGFWVPRPQREPVWVTIKYEMLQIYCYDCGQIGHEAKSCKKFNGINHEFNGINHEFNGIKAPGNKGKTTDCGDDSTRQLWRYPDMEAGTNQKFNGINHEFNGIKAPGNGHFLIKELVKAPIQKDLVKAPMQKERNFKIVELPADTVTTNMVEELIFPTAIHQVSLSSPINSPISINQGHVIRHLPEISEPNTHQPSTNSDPGNQQPTTIPGPITHNPPYPIRLQPPSTFLNRWTYTVPQAIM
ncbi:hypothetical protein K1719_009306 [Acacia pycnantha]|nr:hypothetical protein K1719_009306 [Acacia pycnantha]